MVNLSPCLRSTEVCTCVMQCTFIWHIPMFNLRPAHVVQDIWRHIHSLLPLRDAARAACLSHSFLRSWRCHPNLTLNMHVLGSNANVPRENSSCIIDNILRKHSGSHIKILKLQLYGIYDSYQYLDSWLQVAVTPGIEELTIEPCHSRVKMKQNVPCKVLSYGVRNSIRCLQLSFCAFHPTADLGLLRNLTSLCLESVHILDDEFECFLSNSPALERLDVNNCSEIMCMRIPCVLLQLHCLKVSSCLNLRVLESKARNLSSFILNSGCNVKVSLGETLQMKSLGMRRSNLICYARAEFPSNLPKLESLCISSDSEVYFSQLKL